MLHLDSLRFLAATAVVIFHWREQIVGANGRELSMPYLQFLTFSVDLFFLISGVVMYQVYAQRLGSDAEFGTFIKRRFARLYPLHFLTFLIMLAAGIAIALFHFHTSSPEIYDSRQILPNLLLLQSTPLGRCTFNTPSWSISAEMMCYMLLPAILYLSRKRWWIPGAIGVALAITLTIIAGGATWTGWVSYFGCLRALPTFLIGVSLGASTKLLVRIPAPQILLVIFLIIFAVLGFMNSPKALLLTFVYLIGIVAFAADAKKSSSRIVNLFAPLGLLTYSLYMIHSPYQTVVLAFGAEVLHLSPLVNNLLVVLSYPVLIALAYVSYTRFETPARRLISGMTLKKRKIVQV